MGWQPETQPKGKPPVEKTEGAETMQRLIDANALKESIDEHVYLVNHGFNESEYGITQYGIHQIIDDAPTIDTEPVRHGKWECTYLPNGFLLEQKCSECGLTFEELSGHDYNYCPQCGADMREKKND